MREIRIACECDEEEHEVEVEAEWYPQPGSRIGLYAPTIGDMLPCGREINQADLNSIFSTLEDRDNE